MRAKTIAAFLAAAAIVGALAVPAGASAAHHRVRQSAEVSAEIHGRATNGFRFFFFSFHRGYVLWVTKRVSNAGEEDAGYFIRSHGNPAGLNRDVLDVRIGRLGRFRGRFVGTTAETEDVPTGCTGEPTTNEKGFFVGTFSFHGERGFTAIDSRREHGTVTRQGATSCPAPSRPRHEGHRSSRQAKEEAERQRGEFHLLAGDAKEDVIFEARREGSPEPEEGSPTTFEAMEWEKIGRTTASHNASVFALGSDAATKFQTPNLTEPLAEATVTPAAPFSGSATFHLEGPKAASWTGDLAVELPGLGTVPLTGGGIDAGLCQGRTHCTKTLPRPLQKQLERAPFAVSNVEVQTIR